ncbi:MAG: CopG family transcriptional regulator [Verrucomicrobia bacterium GWF2_62_7]|nr:MAG: CopG family transcriptional regulator [Verrucomicrobia bacterium GWF2_62_7]
MGTVTVNIAFQDGLLKDIDRVARSEARSRSDFMREAARAYLQRKERWSDIFAMGQDIARRGKLQPFDVAREIAAQRKRKAAR